MMNSLLDILFNIGNLSSFWNYELVGIGLFHLFFILLGLLSILLKSLDRIVIWPRLLHTVKNELALFIGDCFIYIIGTILFPCFIQDEIGKELLIAIQLLYINIFVLLFEIVVRLGCFKRLKNRIK